MMVIFVSQCEKKALNRTRRVLDTFADRIGDNAWQTVITQDGLLAVKKLLRKTASKNTAVSCHWHRSRSRSDLVWVVGNKLKFNERGGVPVNSTAKDLLHSDWEKGWHQAHSIQILSVLAALLHDIGKATVGFQRKLEKTASIKMGDPYRHEWISLHLFVAMIAGCTSDEDCLKRLATFSEYMEEVPG
ncbi:HD domain-containing protein, partial [bacterium]|nr:HD domain-containing protein [bacterium]